MRLNFGSFINDNLIPAGIGAGGALALDAALSFAAPMLPAAFNTGIARTGVKLAGAIGIGMIASMVGGRRLGEQVMTGALIVTAYDFIKPFAVGVVPGISAYDMGWISPAPQIGVYAGDDNAYSGMMSGVGVYAGDDYGHYGY